MPSKHIDKYFLFSHRDIYDGLKQVDDDLQRCIIINEPIKFLDLKNPK